MPLQVLSPLHKASRQIEVHLSARITPLGLGGGEAHLLSYLAAYGPCPVGELSRVFGHRPSTLTSMLDRLESADLARRMLDPEDRRSFRVSVTTKGRHTGRQVVRILEEFERAVVGRVSPAELAGFRSLVKAVNEVTQVTLRKNGESHERKTTSPSVSGQSPGAPQESRGRKSRRKSPTSGRRR